MNPQALTGMAEDPAVLERAQQEADRLLEELKREVRAELSDAGTLRKRLVVTVPGKVIQNNLKHNFDELRSDVIVPGFRKGRAPMQLIEKRFGTDVRKSLKTTVVGQSFFAAIENEKIEVLGDPLFEVRLDDGLKLVGLDEALGTLELPAEGDFSYSCEVEIKPTFELPELQGIPIKDPKIEVTDADVDRYIERQRKIRGRYEPLKQGGAQEPDDVVIADVTLSVDGVQIKSEENLELGVRGTRLDGIHLPNLGEVLRGAKAGDELATECTVSDDYERPDLRGKPGRFTFRVHEVKRMVPVELEALLSQTGAENEAQLRQFVREDIEAERDRLVAKAKQEQVLDYLLANTKFDLPAGLSARQTDRAVIRKVIELQQSGVPDSEIEANIDALRTSATGDVARALRLDFILEKVAERLEVGVTDEEVNSEIARMARLYRRRFDRVRDDLHQRGLLERLAEQIRQDKCVEQLVRDAQLSPVKKSKKPDKA